MRYVFEHVCFSYALCSLAFAWFTSWTLESMLCWLDSLIVGTPDYPSGIPDMHTIHDPMISVSWIHISELLTELHHPLQYRMIFTIGHLTKNYIATQGKSTVKKRLPSSVDDPRHAYYPTGNWLGDVPSSHRHRRNSSPSSSSSSP
jgi:hypothetical protein